MGSATTFATMIDNPNSEKIFLAEVKPAQQITKWSLTGGKNYCYEVSYPDENVTLADGSTESIIKDIISLELDGVVLSEVQFSLIWEAGIGWESGTAWGPVPFGADGKALVEASAGSYWQDHENEVLYIHPIANDNPNYHTVLGNFWLYFATKGIILNDHFYEPYIADNGIPQLSQRIEDIHWGTSSIAAGSVVFLNDRGYFDQISRSFIWQNRPIKILMGGDLLSHSQYAVIFTGRITDKNFTRHEFTIEINSNSFDLLRQIPINHFWETDYPNLDPSIRGKTIPM